MTYDDLIRTIRGTDRTDWIYHDHQGVWTFRHDLSIRVERIPSHRENDQFPEKWATRHPDPSARQCGYGIFYGTSLVETFTLVSVDGLRATLPMPDVDTKTKIKRYDYDLARIVDNGYLDEYIARSGLTVEP
jgi:hypothetical protein